MRSQATAQYLQDTWVTTIRGKYHKCYISDIISCVIYGIQQIIFIE